MDGPQLQDPPDPLPLSALQHWACCPRPCRLIHLEQAFDDNPSFTAGWVPENAVARREIGARGLKPPSTDPWAETAGGGSGGGGLEIRGGRRAQAATPPTPKQAPPHPPSARMPRGPSA